MFYVFFTTNNFSFLLLAIVLLMTFLSTASPFASTSPNQKNGKRNMLEKVADGKIKMGKGWRRWDVAVMVLSLWSSWREIKSAIKLCVIELSEVDSKESGCRFDWMLWKVIKLVIHHDNKVDDDKLAQVEWRDFPFAHVKCRVNVHFWAEITWLWLTRFHSGFIS